MPGLVDVETQRPRPERSRRGSLLLLAQDAGGLANHGLIGPGGRGGGGAAAAAAAAAATSSSFRPPLFLQHDGHSRTVVGIERRVVGRAG
jgi:hypothetical protein